LKQQSQSSTNPSNTPPILEQTSKSVLSRITTDALLTLYERFSVTEIANLRGPKLSATEKRRLKQAIWSRLKKAGYKARPSGEAVRKAKIGRPRKKLTMSTHPGEAPADKWKIVELKAAGMSSPAIARNLGRSWPSIYLTLRKLGFPDGKGVGFFYSFGELFDRSALQHLHVTSGLSVTEFGQQLGIPFGTTWAQLREKKAGQLHFQTACKASEWRTRLFQHLMSAAIRRPRQASGYGQNRVILTLFPNLRERYVFLLDVLDRLGEVLRPNSTWCKDDLRQYLCAEAMLEHAGQTPGTQFIRFLPWAPDLVPFLASKLDQLRSNQHDKLAREAMAEWLHTTEPVIGDVVHHGDKIKPIAPQEMRWLILSRAEAARDFEKLAKAARVLEDNWRPDGWNDVPEQTKMIGDKLLSSRGISNPDLKRWLRDNGHKCPNDKSIQRIRTLVKQSLGPRGKSVNGQTPDRVSKINRTA